VNDPTLPFNESRFERRVGIDGTLLQIAEIKTTLLVSANVYQYVIAKFCYCLK